MPVTVTGALFSPPYLLFNALWLLVNVYQDVPSFCFHVWFCFLLLLSHCHDFHFHTIVGNPSHMQSTCLSCRLPPASFANPLFHCTLPLTSQPCVELFQLRFRSILCCDSAFDVWFLMLANARHDVNPYYSINTNDTKLHSIRLQLNLHIS